MFRYVKSQNYRSLVNFHVDLTSKRGTPKKFILVYGENGVGKSNFASIFYTLFETLQTKSIISIIESLRVKEIEEIEELEKYISLIKENFKDIEEIIQNCKTVSSEENMILEYGFKIKGKSGMYRLETDDKKIVSEHMEFVLNKNQTFFFDIKENDVKINEGIFKKAEYAEEVKDLLDKYWGKHSLLSILVCEIEDKKEGYVKNRICKSLYDVISYFMKLSIHVKDGYRVEKGKMGISHKILADLNKGNIDKSAEGELNKAELLLNEFYTHLYSDVKQVFYKKVIEEQRLKYRLFFKKLICGKLIDIDFEKESTGTQYLLEMVPFFMASVEGQTAILDEMDTGIHDLLVNTILENFYDSIQGQTIITTHNTMLLESALPKENIYIFKIDQNANKELLPLNSFEERLHPNLNIRKRYLKGLYGGIPMTMDIDFNELLEFME